jgi:hypothetical protein
MPDTEKQKTGKPDQPRKSDAEPNAPAEPKAAPNESSVSRIESGGTGSSAGELGVDPKRLKGD